MNYGQPAMRLGRIGIKIKGFFFDLDGTLVNSTNQIIESVFRTRSSLEYLQAPEGFVESKIGLPAKELFGDLNLEEAEALRAVILFRSNLIELRLNQSDLYEGVPEFLDSLHENGVSLAVVTNKPTNLAIQVLEDTGIRRYFDFVIGADNLLPKPSPEMILKCLALKSIQPKEAVMVGDRIEDVLAAKSAGVFAVGIGQGIHTEDELLNSGAQATFQSISEFHEWIKSGGKIENL